VWTGSLRRLEKPAVVALRRRSGPRAGVSCSWLHTLSFFFFFFFFSFFKRTQKVVCFSFFLSCLMCDFFSRCSTALKKFSFSCVFFFLQLGRGCFHRSFIRVSDATLSQPQKTRSLFCDFANGCYCVSRASSVRRGFRLT
jgi:hypothetical protein